MAQRTFLAVVLVLIALLALALPAGAGGAATISLDEVPSEVHAGETLHLTFTVRQHGQRPVDDFPEVGPVQPYLEATHEETGERLRVAGYKPEGAAVGHFAVDVTFPQAGTWRWRIEPHPFELLNPFEPLTVQPARAAPATTTQPSFAAFVTPRLVLRGLGLGLVGAALVVALARRQPSRRPRAALGAR